MPDREPRELIPPDGWLAEQIQEDIRALRATYDRNILSQVSGHGEDPRIRGEDAADLYQRLDKRFRSWTGMPLKDFPHA